MIELETLEQMFSNIAAGPKWDMSGPMLWGYFFTDGSREKLSAVIGELERDGYRFVDLFEAEVEADAPQCYFLHVKREEAHSPLSLHERNGQLYAFAERHGLDSYDGMDVGPISTHG